MNLILISPEAEVLLAHNLKQEGSLPERGKFV
jgi:hypothetical protein